MKSLFRIDWWNKSTGIYWNYSLFCRLYLFLNTLQFWHRYMLSYIYVKILIWLLPKPAVPSLDVWLFLAKIRCCIQPILFHTFAFLVLLYLQPCLQMARLIFFTFDLWRLKRKILLVLALLGPYIFVAFLR